MGGFEDWMNEKNNTIRDIMNQKIPFIHTEFKTWLTRTWKTKPSSANIMYRYSTQCFLSYFIQYRSPQLRRDSLHTQFLIIRLAIQDIGVPGTLIYSLSIGERTESYLLSDEELQTKLASLLMSLCFVRMEEMANIDLSVSIIDDIEHRAAVSIPPKQSKRKEREMMQEKQKTLKYVQQNLSLFGQQDLENTSDKVQRNSFTYSGLRTGSKLIRNTFAYVLKDLFKHFEFKMQLQTPFDMHLLQNQQHRDSKMNKKFYIFAVNNVRDSIASTLVKNHCEKKTTQIISKQWGGARESEGDSPQQSPLGDNLYLSPQETLASLLSLPIISTQPIVVDESHNDHKSAKVKKSQMQKDDQDVEQQEEAQDSSMTKDSDIAATAEAQKL
ncbi:MAG: hypothetical protein EZS28_035740 [Streblomastix strix]|uniref:Tyr recombinase domain-containing protein n=1 Tax=Streblomastix strix TaxID=222440 RepID=A0A5J4UF36_9EUKA|nr:MAG: hypothetical protein EZS28_035740 [Streblomastix strix]